MVDYHNSRHGTHHFVRNMDDFAECKLLPSRAMDASKIELCRTTTRVPFRLSTNNEQAEKRGIHLEINPATNVERSSNPSASSHCFSRRNERFPKLDQGNSRLLRCSHRFNDRHQDLQTCIK